ncbi:hypothetical protein [Brunnivagina elsteri]|uniref:hypothetical protein n=1 Tax=Brunnivagina elsteri TaxID=1247191 RepID=UPI001177D054|nr:hypothetical protein [Calothrix elsteri]
MFPHHSFSGLTLHYTATAFNSCFNGTLPQLLLQGQCDRINNHLFKFVRGDRNSTQQQIFSNDLMCFRGRSPQRKIAFQHFLSMG